MSGDVDLTSLATRVKAHNDGQWVRDAAIAYSLKQQAKASKEAA